MKFYKVSMLIAAVATFILMAWCGLTAAITTPVLMVYTVEERSMIGILMIAVFVLSGVIATQLSRRLPCPFPQLLMSLVLGAGYTALTAWMSGFTAVRWATEIGGILLLVLHFTGLVLPAVTAACAIASLPSFLAKKTRRKSHSILTFFTLLALIAAADSAMTLLDHPGLSWQDLIQTIPVLSVGRYQNMLRTATQKYLGFPLWGRMTAGGLCLLVLGRALYVAGLLQIKRRSAAAARIQTVTPPPARPITPRTRSTAVEGRVSHPVNGMSAQDSAMLDAMAAQTINGRPIGLNTATGLPSVSGVRT